MSRVISDHDLERARALVQSGSSVRAAAATLGCSAQTLYNRGLRAEGRGHARERTSRRLLDRTPAEDRDAAQSSAHPLDPLYLAIAEASIAVHCGRDIAKALRKVAHIAELLSLDPLVTDRSPA